MCPPLRKRAPASYENRGSPRSFAIRRSSSATCSMVLSSKGTDRWLLANFLYWASLFIGAIVAFVVAALA